MFNCCKNCKYYTDSMCVKTYVCWKFRLKQWLVLHKLAKEL